MDYIIADSGRKEIGYLDEVVSIDVDVGNTNDFELILSKNYAKEKGIGKGCYFLSEGTEYGGIIEEIGSNTSYPKVTFKGYIWREFLNQLVIQPPAGHGYLKVSGDANRIIEQLLKSGTGLLFDVSTEQSGIAIKNYQFRYDTALNGITKMLSNYGARISIKTLQGDTDQGFKVEIEAVKIKNHSEELEYNGDDNIDVAMSEYSRGINHLICLGQGELVDRTVIHLYVQLDGSVGQKQYYSGIHERTAVYDNSSASDVQELIQGGIDRLKNVMNYKSANMTLRDANLEIGDFVAARDRSAGIIMSRPVTNKILRYADGQTKIEYKVKGEE